MDDIPLSILLAVLALILIVSGFFSIAETSAACANSSATPMSRTKRATPATMRADSMRQTAAMAS